MKAALLIVLSLAALAHAGPFGKNTNNQVETDKLGQNQHQYMSGANSQADIKQTQSVEILKQWCFASQMSQPELTASFKKLVGVVKSSPEDQHTESAVLSERICQGAIVQQSSHTGQTEASKGADAQAHELIKDVYMDALISCDKSECMKQLVKIINSNQVDPIRSSYYMTRLAISEQDTVKDEADVKQLAESFVGQRDQSTSELVERQKLFAVTAMLAKSLKNKSSQQPSAEIKQIGQQVAKTIVERYVKTVGQAEVQQFLEQESGQQSEQVAKKIAKRGAALKALANIPGWMLQQVSGVEEVLSEIAANKNEQSTARQSAIECLEENESAQKLLKQLTFGQEEPIEVRVAAYRALMTVAFAPGPNKDEQAKQQVAAEIVDQVVKHCEQQRNQQTDDQFCLYCISHLDNLRSSQQPEHKAIKEAIAKNKQHYMQIQLLVNKFKQQLSDIRKSSRNYKLEQQFNQIDSGLIVEGDIVYDSKHSQQQPQQAQILPKMVRVNMSMPVMGETVNVMEITLRQSQMDEELLGALKLVQGAKFNSESVSQIVGQFKSSADKKSQSGKSAEADLTIKVEGCTVVYVSIDDFKSTTSTPVGHQRSTRSVYSVIDEIVEQLKREPVAFNRGFNFNLNERLAKMLDVDANLIAGLRFDSRASGQSASDFEISTQIEPRFSFEAIVGPAKMSTKKLLQRFSTKTALGLRLRYKSNELVDVQLDLPMNTMELFTVESQIVEKTSTKPHSYTYLPESIYGQEDIYTPSWEEEEEGVYGGIRKFKRSIFDKQSSSSSIVKMFKGKSSAGFVHSYETSEAVARSTGMRGKLRVAVSPKDATFLVQAVAQKYEARMQGYRVQVQKSQRGGEQKQFVVTVSTPGARMERNMQIRLVKQATSQRTVIKSDIQCNQMAASLQCELIHDGRQYAIKGELASTRGVQWRHLAEFGVQRGSQSQTGRIATTYKPYVNIDSTYLRRPIQLQGALSYQQSPKSVITYELKCPTSGDHVQGKFILDSQRPAYLGKRQQQPHMRRSMSPIEFVLEKEVTLTGEIAGQVRDHSFKVQQMLDWNPSKVALKADLSCQHENARKSVQSQIVASLKLDNNQQMLTVERKCPQQSRKEYRLTIASDMQSANSHQMVCELRYNGQRSSNQLIAYKHKVDYAQVSPKKVELGFTVELVDSQRNLGEKFTGRTQLGIERRMKTLKGDIASRDKQAKVDFEFVSLGEHQLEFVFQAPRVQHRCSVRADQRQFSIQSRTEKDGQMLAKVVMSVLKQKGQPECQLLVECPTKNTHLAFDVKLAPAKLSSMAIQTPSFSSKAEFSFDKMSRANNKLSAILGKPFASNYRLKTDLKDLMNRESYWVESAWNGDFEQKSFLRMDSPVYRTDLEFDPSEQSTKFGVFARSKRAANYEQLYSGDESVANQFGDKLQLGNKLWMARSMISSPNKLAELKQKAIRSLFEYADRQQQHKHSLNWSPSEDRVDFAFERQPNTDYTGATFKPMRFTGDLYTSWQQQQQQQVRPSRLSLESELVDGDFELKPFDGQDSYARVNALSRHIRSPFSKHESEIRYNQKSGYKANMKHQDRHQRRHSVDFESDASPKKWAKIAYESDKLGKGQWEHNWRKQTSRRQHPVRANEQEEIYANKVTFKGESPKRGDWQHSTDFQWDEPAGLVGASWQRARRSVFDDLSLVESEAKRERYNAIDYLKHVNGRVNSQTAKDNAELYKLDFDYQPQAQRAALQVSMPEEMLHSSVLEFEPTERLYKFQSKLYNQRTKQPSYELLAATKPVLGLASADQEPIFMEQNHPMYESPIDGRRIASRLFKQPLKLDYSDRQGRVARLDYDLSPMSTGAGKYAGLRQKRAAIYYKDDANNFEHESNLDFYPESLLTSFKPANRQPDHIVLKTSTKYGPVVVRAESTPSTSQLELASPLINAKLTSEGHQSGAELIKFQLDNKQQTYQLAKLVRKTPILSDLHTVAKVAKKIDDCRFEHQTELLVGIVDAIFKVKSQTKVDERQLMTIEGELNKQQEKIVVRVDGKRVRGQAIVDLARSSANLVLDVDDKRTLQHQTRVQRVSEKFFAVDSMTTYKQQPMLKLSGKICAKIFSEPEHLFSGRPAGQFGDEHMSNFEAIVYQPKQLLVRGQYDCVKREARIVFENPTEKRTQSTHVKFDERTQTVLVESRLSSPYGQVYSTQAKINLPGLYRSYKCQQQSCISDMFYQDKSGVWTAKLIPGEKVVLSSPMGKQTIQLAY